MKTPFLILSVLSIASLSQAAFAQNDFRNSFYAEGLGNGGYYSINYEHTISKGIVLRGGFSTFNAESWFPILLGKYFGNGNGHFEVSAGMIYATGPGGLDGTLIREYMPTAFAGYRYQKPGNRLLFRAGYTPYYEEEYHHWVGVSVGVRF